MPQISLSGDERQDFTITHKQKISIKGNVCAGRSAGIFNNTTARHPVEAVVKNMSTGQTIVSQKSGNIGCKRIRENVTVEPGNYVGIISGAGRGDDRRSSGKMTISYEKKTNDESSDEGQEDYFSGISELAFIEELEEKIGINPVYIFGAGAVILLLLILR